jgi:hypothetical protein
MDYIKENTNPTLIYCGNGNWRLEKIAQECGFKYGLRLPQPKYINTDLYFADQNWKKPNKKKYIEKIFEYQPKLATVIDIEHRNQLPEALCWAEEISKIVETIILIPKCTGVINKIPRYINDKKIILGYSVPTKFGATKLSLHFFDNWEIHLLGGAPEKQIEYAKDLNVVSIDCNYHSMKANKFGQYWTGKFNGDTRWWRIYNNNITIPPRERSLNAFEISCKNIYKYWNDKEYDNENDTYYKI